MRGADRDNEVVQLYSALRIFHEVMSDPTVLPLDNVTLQGKEERGAC